MPMPRTRAPSALVTSVFALACAHPATLVPARAQGSDLDWAPIEADTLSLLRDLVRVDTQSGGETRLLELVKARLARSGIEATILEETPGRGNLIARLRGTGRGAPLLILAHVDTVKADAAEGWSADPLAAEVNAAGELVGRGVIDDKDDAAFAVVTLELLKRAATPLARDVVVLLEADEESAGVHGAAWIVRERWADLGPIGAAINEGGRCRLRDGEVVAVGIQTAEKVYNDVLVRLKGESGHSSVPRPGNAILRLGRILGKLEAYRLPLRVTPAALGTIRGFAGHEPDPARRRAMLDLGSQDTAERTRAAELLADTDPILNALLRSTFVPTLVRGGVRENQLPPGVEVNLNVRLLPDEQLDSFLVGLRHALRDEPGVEVVVKTAGEESPPSPQDHPLFRAIEAAARRSFPGASVVPMLSTGATDSRFLRAKGIPCYGISAMPAEEKHELSVHAQDERIPVTSVGRGIRYFHDLVRTYATTPD